MPEWTIEATSESYTSLPDWEAMLERLRLELLADRRITLPHAAVHAGAFNATFNASASSEEEARALGSDVFLGALTVVFLGLLYPDGPPGRTVLTPMRPAVACVEARPAENG